MSKRRSSKLREVLSVVAAMVLVVVLASPIEAQKPFLGRVRKLYPNLAKAISSCKLCHTYDKDKDESPEEKNLNVFGREIQKTPEMKPLLKKDEDYKFTEAELDVFEKVFVSLYGKDTDGDGATNKEEIELATFPADAKSTPAKEALDKYRAEHKK